MRLFFWGIKMIGGAFVIVALMALLTAASLFVLGGFLTSWPVLRLSPRGRKQRALTQVATSLMTLALAFRPDTDDDTDETSA